MRCNIYFCLHPTRPRFPFHKCHIPFHSIRCCMPHNFPPSQTTKAGGKACPTSFYPFRAAPTRLLARIWPKRAVSQGSQKAFLIAGLQATRIPKSGTKRLLAKIWPKRAVSQGSQKAGLIAGLQATRIPKSGAKRLLARIWPKRAVSQGSQKAVLSAGLEATKVSKAGF